MINNQEAQKDAVEQIIERSYNAEEQKLTIRHKPNDWKNVLRFRNWSNLKALTLHNCQISDPDITIIAQLNWPNLQQLHICWNRIQIKQIKIIWQIEWPRLVYLKLYSNTTSWVSLVKMPLSNLNRQLSYLNVAKNPIGCIGAKIMSKANFSMLKQLYAYECMLEDQGVKHLSKSKWPILKILSLQDNNMGIDGFCGLINFNLMKVNQLLVFNNINIWEVVFVALTNVNEKTKIDGLSFLNQNIEKEVGEILKNRFIS